MFTVPNIGIGQMDFASNQMQSGKNAKDKASESFADVMNLANLTAKDFDNGYKPVENVKNDDNKNISNDIENVNSTTNDVDKKTEKYDENPKEISNVKEDKTTDAEDLTNDTEALVQKIAEAIETIIQKINEILGVEPETIDATIEELGMDVSDLLDEDNIKQIVMNIADVKEVDLLINEDINSMIKDVQTELADILSQFENTDLTETLKEQLPQIKSILDGEESVEENFAVKENNDFEIDTKESKNNVEIDLQGVQNSQIENEKEVSVNTTSDFKQSDSKSEDNASNHILENLNQAIDNMVESENVEGISSDIENIQQADIIKQVIDEIKATATKETTSLEVMLNPASLGKVQITVANKNGSMQAQIVAETEAAKNAIESGLASLKDAFESHELKIDAIEVMVGTYQFNEEMDNQQFEQEQQANASGKNGINLNGDVDSDELTEAEQIEVSMMQQRGNTVSYSI